LLDQANATYDIPKRKSLVLQMEEIQQHRGAVGVAYWGPQLQAIQNWLHNYRSAADTHTRFHDAWLSWA
jgi:hypothetical protein